MGKPKGGKQIKEATAESQGFKDKATKVMGGFSEQSFPSQVMEIVGSMGTREGGRQARVKVLSGPDTGKIIRRNVIGPFKVGDILTLKETEIEASPLKGRKR